MSTEDNPIVTEEVSPPNFPVPNSSLNKNEVEGEKIPVPALNATVVVSETIDEEANGTFTKLDPENLEETICQFVSCSNSSISSPPSSEHGDFSEEITIKASDQVEILRFPHTFNPLVVSSFKVGSPSDIIEYDSLEENDFEHSLPKSPFETDVTLDTVSVQLDSLISEAEKKAEDDIKLTKKETILVAEIDSNTKSVCQNDVSLNETCAEIKNYPVDYDNKTVVLSEINSVDLAPREQQIPENIDLEKTFSKYFEEEGQKSLKNEGKISSEEVIPENAVEALIKTLHSDFLNTELLREHKQLTETVLSQMDELSKESIGDQSEKTPQESDKRDVKLIPEKDIALTPKNDQEFKTEQDFLKIDTVETNVLCKTEDQEKTETVVCSDVPKNQSVPIFDLEENKFARATANLPQKNFERDNIIDVGTKTPESLKQTPLTLEKVLFVCENTVPYSQEFEIADNEDKATENSRGVYKFVQKLGSLVFSSITTDNAVKRTETPKESDLDSESEQQIFDQKMEKTQLSPENDTMMGDKTDAKATEHDAEADGVVVLEKKENFDAKTGDDLKPPSQRRRSSGVTMYSIDVIPATSEQLRVVENQFLEDPELPGYDKYLELKLDINHLQQTVAAHVLEIKQKERQILELFPNKVKVPKYTDQIDEKVTTEERNLEDESEDKSDELSRANEIIKQLETESKKLREELCVKNQEYAKLQQYLLEADVVLETYLRRLHDTTTALKREQEKSRKSSENLQIAISNYEAYKRSAQTLQSKEINYKQAIEKLTSDYNKLCESYNLENGENQRLMQKSQAF